MTLGFACVMLSSIREAVSSIPQTGLAGLTFRGLAPNQTNSCWKFIWHLPYWLGRIKRVYAEEDGSCLGVGTGWAESCWCVGGLLTTKVRPCDQAAGALRVKAPTPSAGLSS